MHVCTRYSAVCMQSKHLYAFLILYISISQQPAANWLWPMWAVCRGGNKELPVMCFTKKNGVCIKDSITADREKWERKRPTERKSKWEQAIGKYGGVGWADEKLASGCRGIVFWVLIFWSMLKRRKCNMQWRISNYTLVYCIWEERKSDTEAPTGTQSVLDITSKFFIHALDVFLSYIAQ